MSPTSANNRAAPHGPMPVRSISVQPRASTSRGWQSGKRRRKYVSAKTRREVVAKMRPLIRAAEAGRVSPTRTLKVEEWMHTFTNEVAGTAVRPATLSRYEQELRLHVPPGIGHLRLDKVQPHHLSALYRRLLGTLSPSSVRRVHALVRRSFNVAVRWGYLASNPAQLVDPPPLPHHEIQPLTVEETRRFLKAAEHTPMLARWALALTLGLRQGAVLGLTWDDIDLDKGVLRVRRALQRQSGGRLSWSSPRLPDLGALCGCPRRSCRYCVAITSASMHGEYVPEMTGRSQG